MASRNPYGEKWKKDRDKSGIGGSAITKTRLTFLILGFGIVMALLIAPVMLLSHATKTASSSGSSGGSVRLASALYMTKHYGATLAPNFAQELPSTVGSSASNIVINVDRRQYVCTVFLTGTNPVTDKVTVGGIELPVATR